MSRWSGPTSTVGLVASGAALLTGAVALGVGIGSLAGGPEDPVAAPTPSPSVRFVGPRPLPSAPRVGPGDVLDEADRLRVDGLGPVAVGMSLRQAQAAAGQELVSAEAGGCAFAAPAGLADVRLLLQRGRVARIDVAGASGVATLSGLRLGATVDEARELYGRRLVERDGDLLFTGSDSAYALLLDVEAEQVVGLRAGLAPVVGDDPCG